MTRFAATAGLLLAVSTCALCAQTPTVAVIHGDFLGGAGPETAEISQARYRATLAALEAAGIPYHETADSTVERWGLPDVPVAIMPYSRAVSDDELNHLRAFLRRPGQLIVFYTTRPDLAEEIGVELGPVIREQFAGQFLSVSFGQPRPIGLPDRMTLDARIVRRLRPRDGASVIGRWAAGHARGQPAVITSAKGAFVAAPPTLERKAEFAALLRALIGHFAPEMWNAMIIRDPAQIGPVGHYDSLAQFAAALRERDEHYLAGAKADVREALTLLGDIPYLLADGRQREAIEASRRAEMLADRAWWRSYPSRSPEIRGVWASPTVDGGWDEALRNLAEANFNICFPYMASGAAAYYPSRVLPTTANCSGDPLAEAIRYGREHGVEVHPRILGLFTMGAPPELKQRLKAEGRIAQSPSGDDMNWLCPSNHLNRVQIVQTAVEMVSTWGADGVQLDYLRYPWKDRCVCENCRKRFEADTGVTVANWPADVLTGPHSERFLEWRREIITSLLRTIRQKLRAADPDATLSAAVFINWESHRDTFGQDWKRWIDEGLIDFVSPMTYVADMDKFQDWVRKQESWAGGKVPVAMGIGPFADIDPQITPQGVLDQIQAARRLGCEGFVLFNYQQRLADEYLPRLVLGATSTPATIPTEVR